MFDHLLIYRALATAWLLTNGPTILAIAFTSYVMMKALDKLDEIAFKRSWNGVVDAEFNTEGK